MRQPTPWVLVGAVLAASLAAGSSPPDPGGEASRVEDAGAAEVEVGWSRLGFVARKLFLKAETDVTVSTRTREELAELLRHPENTDEDRDWVRLADRRAVGVTSDTRMPFNRNEVATAWIDGSSGAAVQSEKLNTGSKRYWKLRRYAGKGYFEWRAEPDGGDDVSPTDPDTWRDRRARFLPFEPAPPDRMVVTDSYALLYLLSKARLDREGAACVIHLVSDEQLVRVEFTAGPLVAERMRFDDVDGDGVEHVDGLVEAREVTGTAGWVAEGREGEAETGFLGMRGAMRVLVERGTGIPLQIEGRVKPLGEITVRIREIVRTNGGG